jgi:ribosome modulation factor
MSDTRITRIPFDATALREGYFAGRRGITREANPYQVGTHEALAWGIGWVTGQKKQLRVVDGGRWMAVR